MPYALVLDKFIKQSKLTAKEISHRCEKQGQKITPSYISILRNPSSGRTPSDDVSRMLEQVLGIEDNALVIEAFMDNAPESVQKAFQNLQKQALYAILASTHADKLIENEKQVEARVEQEIAKMPFYEVIKQLVKNVSLNNYTNLPMSSTFEQDGEQCTLNLQAAPRFEIKDDIMSPILPQGGYVELEMQQEYHNGDIVALMYKGKSEILYRQWSNPIPRVVMLMAFDGKTQAIKYDNRTMLILGKVTSYTKKI